MPLNILGTALIEGTDKIPYYKELKAIAPYVAGIGAVKYLSRGSSNIWERNLHGKVYIVTGATSQGMGTSVVLDLARRGAQLIILTRRVDEWSTEWCEDLRLRTDNEMIYLEQCDISDLYEVRKFATKWLDNSPPRRLDGIVVMSGNIEPWGIPVSYTHLDVYKRQPFTWLYHIHLPFKILLVRVVALGLYCYQYQHSRVCVSFGLKSILLLLVRRLLTKNPKTESLKSQYTSDWIAWTREW